MAADYEGRTAGQRLWLASAASLLAVLAAGGGWLAWQGLRTAAPPLITAPATVTPVGAGRVAFGAPELIDGVPWGFPLTPQGAAAAAVTAVAVTGQPGAVFDADRFDAVAAVVFSPEQVSVQSLQVAAARTEFDVSGWAAQPDSRRTYFLTPLAVRLISYTADLPGRPQATLEVWAMTIVGVGDAGGAVFTTSTVELAVDASGATWHVVGLESVEGPTPLIGGIASAPGRTRGFLRDALPTVPLPLPVRSGP